MSNGNVDFINKNLQKGYPEPLFAETEQKFMYLFSILDKKTGKFLPPFVAESIKDGVRQFTSLINYSQSLICNFPEDYKLTFIGIFDPLLGSITPPDKPLSYEGSSLKRPDSERYRNLLNYCKSLQTRITTAIKDFEKYKDDFKNSVELFPINKTEVYPKSKTKSIKGILDSLFGNY